MQGNIIFFPKIDYISNKTKNKIKLFFLELLDFFIS
jgi:hypothetical protein